MTEVRLEGWEDLISNLNNLAPRMQKNILRGALRNEAGYLAEAVKGAAPLLNPETANPHERYVGQLRDSVRAVSLNPSATPGAVAAGVRVAGSSESLQSTIKAGRALNKGKLKAAAKELLQAAANGFYWRWIEYGSPHNSPPRPFIRDTWDSQKSGSLVRIKDYIATRLDKLTHD